MYFEHEMTVTVEKNDADFFVCVTVTMQDDSFDHGFGRTKVETPVVSEIEVYQNDEKITDPEVIQIVEQHYTDHYLDSDVA
jgi:hypothetical protein